MTVDHCSSCGGAPVVLYGNDGMWPQVMLCAECVKRIRAELRKWRP